MTRLAPTLSTITSASTPLSVESQAYSKLAAVTPVVRQQMIVSTLLDTMKSVSFHNLIADTAAWFTHSNECNPMMKAIDQDNHHKIDQLASQGYLNQKAKVVLKNKAVHKISPLLYAVMENRTKTVENLLRKGAKLESEAPKALMASIAHKNLAMVKLICEHVHAHGDFLNKHPEMSSPKLSPLLLAVKKGAPSIAEYLVKRGADIHQFTFGEPTPLCVAIKSKNERVVKALIAQADDLDVAFKENITPLMFAIEHGNKNIVKLLLDKGADSFRVIKGDCSPLILAVQQNKFDIVKLILDKMSTSDEDKNIALSEAMLSRQDSIAETLIKKGAGISQIGNSIERETVLDTALQDQNTKVIKSLIDQGGDPNQKLHNGMTPLLYTIFNNDIESFKVLMNSKYINIDDGVDDLTPLNTAIGKNNSEMVQLLIEKGVKDLKPGQISNAPLEFALTLGHTKIANLLCEAMISHHK